MREFFLGQSKEYNDDLWPLLVKEVDANSDGRVKKKIKNLRDIDFIFRIQGYDVQTLVKILIYHLFIVLHSYFSIFTIIALNSFRDIYELEFPPFFIPFHPY